MAIVSGRVLPDHKHIWVALTSIYGVGRSRALQLCKELNLPIEKKVRDLSEQELETIRAYLARFVLESDLRREESAILKMLSSIGCYRGIRARRGLPRRGQRTRTNARTAKRAGKSRARRV